MTMDIWPKVDELVDRARTTSDLHAHRLDLYAAARLRAQGRAVPRELIESERIAALRRMTAPALLGRVRDAYPDGKIVLLKGAQAAACYPRPELRPSADLDLLVEDAEVAQRSLLAAGFRLAPYTEPHGHHHDLPLEWPGLGMFVEIHSRPSWPLWMSPPPTQELLAVATSESVLAHGVMALPRTHHTLLLLTHLWRESPLSRLGHLLDVLMSAEGQEAAELGSLARAWKLDRLWNTTVSAVDAIFSDRPTGASTRFLTRHFATLRERTVIEEKAAEMMAPFVGMSPGAAIRATATGAARELRPSHDETWGEKIKRSAHGLSQAFLPRSARDRSLLTPRRRRDTERPE